MKIHYFATLFYNKTCVINDPLGQTHTCLASSDHYFLLFCFARFEKWVRTDGTNGRTKCAKIIITTGRDFWSAEWINKQKVETKLIAVTKIRNLQIKSHTL